MTAAELAARQRHAARQREGHRGAAWEGLPEMMREEMAYRELAAIVDNEQRIAAPAAGTGCGFARASRLVAGGYLLRTWLEVVSQFENPKTEIDPMPGAANWVNRTCYKFAPPGYMD